VVTDNWEPTAQSPWLQPEFSLKVGPGRTCARFQ
jgi:hypothetical protein